MTEQINVNKGERYVYTGAHAPWRGHTGTVDRIEEPFEREGYKIARLWWDDPPDKQLSIAYITPYNVKQWSLLDDASRDDRPLHQAAQQDRRHQR